VERELVLRLASLLWRLRRVTTIETGLFEIQADHLSRFRQSRKANLASREIVYALFRRAAPVDNDCVRASHCIANGSAAAPGSASAEPGSDAATELGRCFCGSPISPTSRSTG
jgi:hypothetical protein